MNTEDLKGLKFKVFDDNFKEVYSEPMNSWDYEDFKKFYESARVVLGKNIKLTFEEIYGNSGKIIEINLISDFESALGTITGQGLLLRLKKTFDKKGPWKCSRCQFFNQDEASMKCGVCKLDRR